MVQSLAATRNYQTFRFKLPFPPSVNHYWRRQGHRYFVSKQGVKFRKEVVKCVTRRANTRRRLAVTIAYERKDNIDYDIDNYAKAVLDALAYAGVFQNDKQVDRLEQERLPVKAPGACYVTIQEIGPAKTEVKV